MTKQQSPVQAPISISASQVLGVSIPTMLSQFIMTLGGFISALILSYLSTQVFAASTLILSLQLAITVVPFSLFFCLSPLVSHFVASKENLFRVGALTQASLVISLFVGAILMVLLWQIKPLLLALGQPADLATICDQYFKYFLWCIPATALLRVLFQVAMGLFCQQFVFLVSFLGLLLTTLLGIGLVFGSFGFPKMGVAGLGLSYVIQSAVMLLIFVGYFGLKKTFRPYGFFKMSSRSMLLSFQGRVLKIGSPIIVQTGNEILSFLATTIMVGWLGATALMAKQIVVRYLMLLVIPLFGLSQAASVFVGKFSAQKSVSVMQHAVKICFKIGLIYAGLIVVIFAVAPGPFIRLFLNAEQPGNSFYSLVAILLVIVAIGQVFDTIKGVAVGALRGIGDTHYAMVVSLFCVWPIGITLAYLFGFTFHWGLIGMSVAHNIAIAIAAIALYYRWRTRLKALKS